MDSIQERSLPPQGSRTPRGRRSGSIVPAPAVSSSDDGPSVVLSASITSEATIAVGCVELDEKSSHLEKDVQIDKQMENIVHKDVNYYYEHESILATMKNAQREKVKKEGECEVEDTDEEKKVDFPLKYITHETNKVKERYKDLQGLLTASTASVESKMDTITRVLNLITKYTRRSKKEIGKLKNRKKKYEEMKEEASREKELFIGLIHLLEEKIKINDEIIKEEDKVIQNRKEVINQKHRIIKEMEEMIDEKNKIIKKKINEVEKRDIRISDLQKNISSSVESRKTFDLREDTKHRSENKAALNMRLEKIMKQKEEIYTSLCQEDEKLSKIKGQLDECLMAYNQSMIKIDEGKEKMAALYITLEKITKEKNEVYTSLCQEGEVFGKIKRLLDGRLMAFNP